MAFRLSDHLDKWVLRPPWARETNLAKPGCVLWVGARRPTRSGLRPNIHRNDIPYRLLMGSPPGMDVCHSCDRSMCCSTDHLWIGSRRQNMADAKAKGRTGAASSKWTHCKRGHPLSGDNVRLSVVPESRRHKNRVTHWRGCRECDRISMATRDSRPGGREERLARQRETQRRYLAKLNSRKVEG